MRAAVLTGINQPLEILDLEIGRLEKNQVLVKVIQSGLCGAQLQEISGLKGNARFIPHTLGHEGVGIVESCGEDVKNFSIGDKVVMHWRINKSPESDFPKYLLGDKVLTGGKVNTLMEKAIVSENRITKVPNYVSNDLAALLGCSLSTAYGAVMKQNNLQPAHKILVLGGGGLGFAVTMILKSFIGCEIHLLDREPEKESLARKLGVNVYATNISQIEGDVFDAIFDTLAIPELFKKSVAKLNHSGTYCLIAQPKPNLTFEIPNAVDLFGGDGKRIFATQGGGVIPNEDFPQIIENIIEKNIQISELISHRFKINQVNEALDLIRSGKAVRIMVDML